jgi:hypothetical protein
MKTYTPKIERGQMAWFMKDNKTVQQIIGSIQITDVGDEQGKETYVSFMYKFRVFDIYNKFKEWKLMSLQPKKSFSHRCNFENREMTF